MDAVVDVVVDEEAEVVGDEEAAVEANLAETSQSPALRTLRLERNANAQ